MSVPLRTVCSLHKRQENKNTAERGSSDEREDPVIEAGRTNFLSLVRKNDPAPSISTLVNHGQRE